MALDRGRLATINDHFILLQLYMSGHLGQDFLYRCHLASSPLVDVYVWITLQPHVNTTRVVRGHFCG